MGTGSFLGIKWPGRSRDHPPPFSAEVKERVELYIDSPSGPSWTVLGQNLPLVLFVHSDFPLKWKVISCCMEKKSLFIRGVVYQDINTIYGKNAGSLYVQSGGVYTEPLRSKELKSNNSYISCMADYFTVHKSGRRLLCS